MHCKSIPTKNFMGLKAQKFSLPCLWYIKCTHAYIATYTYTIHTLLHTHVICIHLYTHMTMARHAFSYIDMMIAFFKHR